LIKFILHTDKDTLSKSSIGGKARNLHHLVQLGFPVPTWGVIPLDSFNSLFPNVDSSSVIQQIEAYSFPEDFAETIMNSLGNPDFVAVRSSAIDEDGNDHSFAGQFETYLYVTKEKLTDAIKDVWRSASSERVKQYREYHGISAKTGIAVIVQTMVNSDVSGVAFGFNPVTGNRDERFISVVYGLGEGLVSGELDADNFILNDSKIEAQITVKTKQLVLNSDSNLGTKLIDVNEKLQSASTLSDEQVNEIGVFLDKGLHHFGKIQDMEFAYANGTLYIFQTRPVTNLDQLHDPSGNYILWDNSNIVESYPGVTTPLTFSFILKSYEGAYKLFCEFMGVNSKVIKEHEEVFANTLGLLKGRVYYNLKSWYLMLAMLPGYSINARFMENMMGVKVRFDVPESLRLSKRVAFQRILLMVWRMFWRLKRLPKKRAQFVVLLNKTIAHYKQIDFNQKNSNELMQLYLDFENKLLNEWKAPLLNDFFAMIWFGMLQKKCAKYGLNEKNPNIHNDLLCGSSDIISTQPIHRSIELATSISAQKELATLFKNEDETTIWHTLNTSEKANFNELKQEIDRYIDDFGERCIGELKLESISYTQDPTRFVKILKSYIDSNITSSTTSGQVEEEIRQAAEMEIRNKLKGKFLKRYLLRRTLKKARELVSARENLRYERTRAFGIVRELFSAIEKNWYKEGILNNPRDIFYLTKEEIFAYIQGTSVTANVQGLIDLRKEEFDKYKQEPAPSERFATYGPVYHANDFYHTDKVEIIDGDLKGIGCCPGHVTGRVRVVLDPNKISSLDGDILVTSSTDSGWVTLFPSAAAIIVERGSLLSHSAIVSREMGIPCIVSVTGLLKTLKTGDLIEMDGSTGVIKRISESE